MAAAASAASGCGSSSPDRFSVIDAGSLIIPFDRLADAYEQAHPGADVQTESHGSIQVIRQVTDLHRRFDVLATADAALIPVLMETPRRGASRRPTGTPCSPRTVWCWPTLPAAASRPSCARRTGSRLSRRRAMRFGLADPRFDAAGYRALMVLQLAEHWYGDAHLFEDLTARASHPPVTVTRKDGVDVIDVPELLQAVAGSGLVLRGASIQLVALLESGDLDCAFEYESVVRQHGLPFVELPAQIDLGAPRWARRYGRVAVAIAFRRFATVKPVFRGEPIRYAVTIPVNAPHPEAARDFVAFLLGADGRRILTEAHQPSVTPALVDHYDELPAELRGYVCR